MNKKNSIRQLLIIQVICGLLLGINTFILFTIDANTYEHTYGFSVVCWSVSLFILISGAIWAIKLDAPNEKLTDFKRNRCIVIVWIFILAGFILNIILFATVLVVYSFESNSRPYLVLGSAFLCTISVIIMGISSIVATKDEE